MPIFKRKVSQLSSEVFDMPTPRPSSSSMSLKIAATIESAIIVSSEKLSDKKIWYIVEIKRQQNQCRMPNTTITYRIARRYSEFARLSQELHTRFKTTKLCAGSYLPPKMKNTKLSIFPKSKELREKRFEELNQFLRLLFRKQSIITESQIVLDFFQSRKADLIYAATNNTSAGKQGVDNDDIMMMLMEANNKPIESVAITPPGMTYLPEDQHQQESEDRPPHGWKRLRCTTILSRSSMSTSSVSSFCSQAAHKLIPSWHHPLFRTQATDWHNPSPTLTERKSFSNPREKSRKNRVLKKCQSSPGFIIREHSRAEINSPRTQEDDADSISMSFLSVYQEDNNDNNRVLSLNSFTEYVSGATIIDENEAINNNRVNHETEDDYTLSYNDNADTDNSFIKFKIIYDIDKIVAIRVLRTISLSKLRQVVIEKFGERHGLNISLGHNTFVLLYNDTNRNCCHAQTVLTNEVVLPAKIINKEKDLRYLLDYKWRDFERVALRCILV